MVYVNIMQSVFEEFKEKDRKPFWLICKTYETQCQLSDLKEVAQMLGYKEGWAHVQHGKIKTFKQIETKSRTQKLSLDNITALLNSAGIPIIYAPKLYLGNI